MTCTAVKPITGLSSLACLFCDLPQGHNGLHLDEHDQIWWKSREERGR